MEFTFIELSDVFVAVAKKFLPKRLQIRIPIIPSFDKLQIQALLATGADILPIEGETKPMHFSILVKISYRRPIVLMLDMDSTGLLKVAVEGLLMLDPNYLGGRVPAKDFIVVPFVLVQYLLHQSPSFEHYPVNFIIVVVD